MISSNPRFVPHECAAFAAGASVPAASFLHRFRKSIVASGWLLAIYV